MRVIGLIDLDAFYAQCEAVRLGLPPSTTALVVLQWSMVLAVSYPARALGIKRGMYYNDIKQHSACYFIHVETYSIDSEDEQFEVDDGTVSDTRVARYERQYSMTPAEQRDAIARENHVRPSATTAKASIERYRYCSGLIFKQIRKHLGSILPPKSFVLEKASVDELFLDLTAYCCCDDAVLPSQLAATLDDPAYTSRVLFGDASALPPPLSLGASIVASIRANVFEELGYTMSAGVYTNKSIAKLLASENKPNGQATMHPSGIDSFLLKTPMVDVRFYGGKFGQRVVDCFLSHSGKETEGMSDDVLKQARKAVTMSDVGSIPISYLEQNGFTSSTARSLLNLCQQGEEEDSVDETLEGAPTKSINCYKSFVGNGSLEVVRRWSLLLGEEMAKRVTDDAARNSRFPKTLTCFYQAENSNQKSRSIQLSGRISKAIIQEHMEKVLDVSLLPLIRIGLAVSNFQARDAKGGIASFFRDSAASPAKSAATPAEETTAAATPTKATVEVETDEQMALRFQQEEEDQMRAAKDISDSETDEQMALRFQQEEEDQRRAVERASEESEERDAKLARDMQMREEMVGGALKRGATGGGGGGGGNAQKKQRQKPKVSSGSGKNCKGGIQSFFQKK
jgi:DNA polymerase eta